MTCQVPVPGTVTGTYQVPSIRPHVYLQVLGRIVGTREESVNPVPARYRYGTVPGIYQPSIRPHVYLQVGRPVGTREK
jgi:hypothetical protein